MRVLIIRHGVAEDPTKFAKGGGKDEARPLTEGGGRKMRDAAKGLRRVVKRIDVMASSPLARAMQTAEIVSKVYGGKEVVCADVLKPGKRLRDVLTWLQGQPGEATVALVGHEPQLGTLMSWLMTGEQRSVVDLKKGAAGLLAFEGRVKAGEAKLLWLLKPSHLRELR